MQHMFLIFMKFQYSIHICLIIFQFYIKLICFKTQNIKFRLKSTIILIAFWKYFSCDTTQNIIWEKFKFLEYLISMSPSFHEHFVLNQDHDLIFFCSWKKYIFSFCLSLFHFPFSELSL